MQKTTSKTSKVKKSGKGFSDFERAAMQERAKELLMEKKGDGESMLLAKLSEMPEPDRAIGKKLHTLVKTHAPTLISKTWYGMPAYANKEGKVVCFFQGAHKFKARYATLGFSDLAKLDEGEMWPTSFALKKLSAVEEKKIIELLKKAVG